LVDAVTKRLITLTGALEDIAGEGDVVARRLKLLSLRNVLTLLCERDFSAEEFVELKQGVEALLKKFSQRPVTPTKLSPQLNPATKEPVVQWEVEYKLLKTPTLSLKDRKDRWQNADVDQLFAFGQTDHPRRSSVIGLRSDVRGRVPCLKPNGVIAYILLPSETRRSVSKKYLIWRPVQK
jgi:hypothetical protein